MRLSGNEKDRGYCALTNSPISNDIKITLDGVEVSKVETADEELGEIVRGVTDESGAVRFEDGGFVRETLRGKVVIHTPPGFPRNRLYWIVPRVRERVHRWYRRHVYAPVSLWRLRLRSRVRRILL